MNAPHPALLPSLLPNQQHVAPPVEHEVETDLRDYWDIIVDSRWLIAGITAVALGLGAAYALFARPVFESNLLIQVEDSAASAKSFLGETASLFDVKTPATAEIEILRSRMVISQAADTALFYVQARPRYLPVIGDWLARHAKSLSTPLGGWVHGAESITVSTFNVPQQMEGTRFTLTAGEQGTYVLSNSSLPAKLSGRMGAPLVADTPAGRLELTVTALEARPGAEFRLVRNSRLKSIERLQADLKLSEKGRQSGVIEATLRDSDPQRLTLILNEIARHYVQQNVARKAAEAQKTLTFLEVQLPQFKRQLDQAEEAYSRYRNQKGTVALDEEAKLILTQSVELHSKLIEAEQRRRELLSRYTSEHPAVKTLDAQIGGWNREIDQLNGKVRTLPNVQQDAVRLERDVKVNNELYQQLRNNLLQLQLVREGKIGNVRLIDGAVQPEEPVQPKGGLTIGIALLFGLIGGVMTAIARNTFFRGVRNPREIEAQTGIDVYGTIPLSPQQEALAQLTLQKKPGIHLLAAHASHDPAVESLRSLSTALQFAMLEASNNRVLITGATPGVGKSFVSSNFAAVLAGAGKKVLLIDCDLRRGFLNQVFGLPRARGVSEVVAGSIPLEDALHRNVVPNLDFLSTGVLPPNPAALVMSSAFLQLLDQVSEAYDLIIADTAPVLAAADTLSVAPHMGTLLVVARAGVTQIGEIHESTKRLTHAGKGITGFLFNALDLSRRYYGSYGYRYGGYKYGGYKYQQYSYQPQQSR